MNRTGSGNSGRRSRRRPRIDSENVRITRCKYCKQPITFSYGSVGRDGKKVPTNLKGTMHIDGGPKR